MKLIDALKVAALPIDDAAPVKKIFLACGMTPLHLQTFLVAQMRMAFPGCRVSIKAGLFGDLCGNIERLQADSDSFDSLIVIIEWSDLDSRLGLRTLGGWRPSQLSEIVESASHMASRIETAVAAMSHLVPAIVCMPTLPLLPLFSSIPSQQSMAEIQLRQLVTSMAASLTRESGIRIASGQRLDEISPLGMRYDVTSDLTSGFPYRLNHASAVAEVLGNVILNSPQKKGLITDLDNTLWSGILGEDGQDGISWNLDQHSQMHGLYQQCLASLAGAGVLIGVASKNDRANVERAFERTDLLISKNDIFPFETHWSSKSESVGHILKTWNVGPDSVVFVDDSPMEVAEVQAAFPEMVCIDFPNGDYAQVLKLLYRLRELFGKPVLTDDDAIRLRSIRDSGVWREASGNSLNANEEFLEAAEAQLVFEVAQPRGDTRAFELLNKTNQFNLNGRRLTETEWAGFLKDPDAFILAVSYTDKFGALGKISAMAGTTKGRVITLASWALSCRAFSRRVEYQCLKYLLDTLGADEIVLDYQPTPRNKVLQSFLESLLGKLPEGSVRISRELYTAKAPRLFHRVEGIVHV